MTAAPRDVPPRTDFTVWWPTQTRWADNDQYGHANNVVYYSWFDTAVNGLLMQRLGSDVRDLPAIGVVAETSCRYLAQVGFPQALEVGIAVERLGTSSVTYRLAVFRVGAADPAAVGRFVHVYVDPGTRRPVPVPQAVRDALADLTSSASNG
ncbi:thioesterase family protein [Angustibacter sp. Root456]|uniref:acyl-CoA thioesterase n=1 Tax=Angustibacter sp. Root456 TaxID=1736539 RepID=UPI0006F2EDC4|nr:thioesterase family protein [Angustibacter sp. Root456]KQX62029.1 4-hydroxybenzoyl-CoA thioesterase [Angustibacter sp. Root456]